MKNPTWKEYFKTKGVAGYVRGFYDHVADNIWVWPGDVLHRKVKERLPGIPDYAWKFVLETERFTITGPADGKARMVSRLKQLEPNSQEEQGWIS